MKIDIELQGRSFVAVTDSEFAAAAAYGVFRSNANGGGMGLDFVRRDGPEWRVREKHSDGGAGLVRALRRLGGRGLVVEFSAAALDEAERRLADDDRGRGR